MLNWESKLAAVILNYNSFDLTQKCVKNLIDLSKELTIVVVDNNSNDNSWNRLVEELSKFEKVTLIHNQQNAGYASGNNVGIKYIRDKYNFIDAILIINPDIIVPSIKVLHGMYEALHNDKNIGAITVQTVLNGTMHQPNECSWKFLTPWKLFAEGNIIFGRWVKRDFTREYVINNNVAFADVVQGCFFMITISCLNLIGDLDEHTFLYSEEQILAKKLIKNGYYCAVIPFHYVYHNHQTKDKQLIKRKNKLFDTDCFYNSKIYYIKKYSEYSDVLKTLLILSLQIDRYVKKIVFNILLKD